MTFKDQNWSERVAVLGDPAESAFMEHARNTGLSFVKFGLDRPPIDLRRIPGFVRYTPDFLTPKGLIEVQGCGRDQTFKFKHDKLTALRQWQRHAHVNVWLWNEPLDDWRMLPVPKLWTLCQGRGGPRIDGTFDPDTNAKPYAAVRWIDVA